MKVETIREHAIDPGGDTIRITDFDQREVYFHRNAIPELINRLQYQRSRGAWQETKKRLKACFLSPGRG